MMKTSKIQSLRDLRAEMKAVVSDKMQAPADAGEQSFESAQAVMRLLSEENRALLRAIDSNKPASIAELARLVHRAEPNVSRSLAQLVGAGFVELHEGSGKSKVPEVKVRRLTIEIDALACADQVRAFPA
jgi:predicted transcriptional regulator